jgi:hypothetical protein
MKTDAAGTLAGTFPAHQAATEAAVLEALPRDLAQVLTGALVQHLEGPATFERWCLVAAHAELCGGRRNTAAALGYLRAGLAQAIQPGHVEPRPETILLQVAFWLLSVDVQCGALLAACAAAAAGCSMTTPMTLKNLDPAVVAARLRMPVQWAHESFSGDETLAAVAEAADTRLVAVLGVVQMLEADVDASPTLRNAASAAVLLLGEVRSLVMLLKAGLYVGNGVEGGAA